MLLNSKVRIAFVPDIIDKNANHRSHTIYFFYFLAA